MARIAVRFAALTEGEQAFRQVLSELRKTLDSLDDDLHGSLTEWEGPARDAYQEFRDLWRETAREVERELDRLHRAIVRSHHNYHAAFTANQRMWDIV